jgi:hypothetical protein
MRPLTAALALALAVPAGGAEPARTRPEAPVVRGPAPATGLMEAGRLLAAGAPLEGPFVLSWLEAGATLELRRGDDPRTPPLGVVTGPLATPFLLPAGAHLTLAAGASGARDSGSRPSPLLKVLEGWVGRAVLVGAGSAEPQAWTLRQVGPEHLLLERNRTFRAVAAGRVVEVGWTELSGIDPTPRLLLAAP